VTRIITCYLTLSQETGAWIVAYAASSRAMEVREGTLTSTLTLSPNLNNDNPNSNPNPTYDLRLEREKHFGASWQEYWDVLSKQCKA